MTLALLMVPPSCRHSVGFTIFVCRDLKTMCMQEHVHVRHMQGTGSDTWWNEVVGVPAHWDSDANTYVPLRPLQPGQHLLYSDSFGTNVPFYVHVNFVAALGSLPVCVGLCDGQGEFFWHAIAEGGGLRGEGGGPTYF